MDRTIISESATPKVALRWRNGRLQQMWDVTRYFDARLERFEGVTTMEWRDVPTVDGEDANG